MNIHTIKLVDEFLHLKIFSTGFLNMPLMVTQHRTFPSQGWNIFKYFFIWDIPLSLANHCLNEDGIKFLCVLGVCFIKTINLPSVIHQSEVIILKYICSHTRYIHKLLKHNLENLHLHTGLFKKLYTN